MYAGIDGFAIKAIYSLRQFWIEMETKAQSLADNEQHIEAQSTQDEADELKKEINLHEKLFNFCHSRLKDANDAIKFYIGKKQFNTAKPCSDLRTNIHVLLKNTEEQSVDHNEESSSPPQSNTRSNHSPADTSNFDNLSEHSRDNEDNLSEDSRDNEKV